MDLRHPLSEAEVEKILEDARDNPELSSVGQLTSDAKSLGINLEVTPALHTAMQLVEKLGAEEAENFLTQGVSAAKVEEETFLTDALRAPAGPPIPEKAFYGLAGRIINKLRPQTESHPMGNLLEFLACFGNIIGGTAYYQIEDTKHYRNIHVGTHGPHSHAAKGNGQERINRNGRAL